ncbi:MAG: DUF4279 domain-containing protein [Gemmataceae bacterium]
MSDAADELRIKLSFRVMGRELDPDEVSAVLRLQPAECHRRDDPHLGKGGRRYGTFREGLWMMRSNAPLEANLEAHLTDILQHLSGREAVLRQFRGNGLRTDLFVGVFGITHSCGFSLSPESARAIGELGLTIGFDLYPVSEQEISVARNSESSL